MPRDRRLFDDGGGVVGLSAWDSRSWSCGVEVTVPDFGR